MKKSSAVLMSSRLPMLCAVCRTQCVPINCFLTRLVAQAGFGVGLLGASSMSPVAKENVVKGTEFVGHVSNGGMILSIGFICMVRGSIGWVW